MERFWPDREALVDQVAYQLEFRSYNDYMSTSPAHLASLLTEQPQNSGMGVLGLYLTRNESDEFERRQARGDLLEDIENYFSVAAAPNSDQPSAYDPQFGGAWLDQMNGGSVTVAVVGGASDFENSIRAIVGEATPLRIIGYHPSLAEIDEMKQSTTEALESAGIDGDVSVQLTQLGKIVEVTVNAQDIGPASRALSAPYYRNVRVVAGELAGPANSPGSLHNGGGQMPGLLIEADPGGYCTWGANGHTASLNYLVTAGHCGSVAYENFAGYTTSFELDQADSLALTSGSQFLFSVFSFNEDAKRMSSAYADDNCYHGPFHCQTFIKERALHNSWELNSDVVCASLGRSDTRRCGYVLEENYVGGSTCPGNRWIRTSIEIVVGDSGSGLVGGWGGALGTSMDGIFICKKGAESIAMTAFDVKQTLNFDFNCASTAVTRSAPQWAACPSVNR
ncbi:MAG: hypothetical protein ACE367_14255 [Acidimicrobiales bacterium]